MQEFRVLYSKSSVIVLVLIVVPLAVSGLLLWLMLSLPRLPDWAILGGSVAMLAVALALTLTILKKWANIPAEINMDEQGFRLRLLRGSPFYNTKAYNCPWSSVSNVGTSYVPQKDKCFYQISLTDPRTSFSLEPNEQLKGGTETVFGASLLNYVATYNASEAHAPQRQIRGKGFYDAWWAKLLTIFAYIMTAAAVGLFLFDRELMPWWRAVQLLTYSAVWLAAYYANRNRSK